MKYILNLFVIFFAFSIFSAPVQAKGKPLPPGGEDCEFAVNFAASLIEQGKKLPRKLRAFKNLCEDSDKNPLKYDWQSGKSIVISRQRLLM